jgi:uncharacterized delta-60 repeat protein
MIRFEPLEDRRLMSAGALDPSFDFDGKASVRFGLDRRDGAYTLDAADVATQRDGKTVVAATYRAVNNRGQADFALVRFNFDGTLDTTFGKHHTGFSFKHVGKDNGRDEARAIAIQPDGKILVAGVSDRARRFRSDTKDMVVARFLPNGLLDTSFADGGTRFIEFGNSEANDIALQRDGKIVLAGSVDGALLSSDFDFAVARLNPDGKLDSTFDGDGKRSFGMGGEDDRAFAVAVDETGSPATNRHFGTIVIGGRTNQHLRDSVFQAAVARLTADGTLDKSFNRTGKAIRPPANQSVSAVNDILIQAGGKIVLAGRADGGFRLERLTPDGTTDASFGPNHRGFVNTIFGGPCEARRIAFGSDSGLVVGGTVNGKFGLARYSADGMIKSSFGNGGKVVTDWGADGTARHVGIAMVTSNRIVMAGGDVLKTARYLDEGANTVVLQPSSTLTASEQGSTAASFFVDRGESLPFATRVFFSVGGTATGPGLVRTLSEDYTLTGMHVPTAIIIAGHGDADSRSFFVDIPAGKASAKVTVTAIDDTHRESVETATFNILPSLDFSRGAISSLTLGIADNDQVIL